MPDPAVESRPWAEPLVVDDALRNRLVVRTQVELAPWSSLRRTDSTSTIVKH